MRHSYATAILMAGMTPAFYARQLGHYIEMFLRTYARWIDGEQNDLEMRRLEASLANRPLEPRGKTVESALEVPQNGVSEQKTQ